MLRRIHWLSLIAVLALCASVLAASTVEIRLKDGSRWRGQISDTVELRYVQQGVELPVQGTLIKVEPLYVVVDGVVAGTKRQVTIFRSDIVSMKTIEAGDSAAAPAPTKSTPGQQTGKSKPRATPGDSANKPGVFVLPLSGMVGVEFRHQEIVKVADEADKYGPGQIIVLLIDSDGGMVEMEDVHRTITQIKKRHRVVAWIKKAISAAAASASACDEIYFMTEGTLGAMTGHRAGQPMPRAEVEIWLETAGRWFEEGGRSKYIAWAMIEHSHMLSYDKDDHGNVTWYNDKSGQVVLSDEKSNLVFTSRTAVDSGFADGIADTTHDLAKLLNLPEWHEISDYGRRISAEWHRICKEAQERIPILAAELQYKNASADIVTKLGTEIGILQELIRWWDRCPNVAQLMLPEKPFLERQIEERRKRVADIRRQQRR